MCLCSPKAQTHLLKLFIYKNLATNLLAVRTGDNFGLTSSKHYSNYFLNNILMAQNIENNVLSVFP